MNETRLTEALRSVIAEAREAQVGVILLLDRLSEVQWPLHTEAMGDLLAAQANGLCKLSSQLSRITIRAEYAIPEYDEAAALDELVAQTNSSEDFDEDA